MPYFPPKNAGYKPRTFAGLVLSHNPYTNAKIQSRIDNTKSDPREAFSINKWPTAAHTHASVLPPVLNEARPQIEAFQKKVQALNRRLLELIAQALGLPRDQFTACHSPDQENFDNFDLMHYPPIGKTEETPADGTVYRISPHTDWGSLTYLFQQDVGGLEVRPPKYTSPSLSVEAEEWTPAPVHNTMILVNIGDMLEFWTAGALKSTWHRVVPNTRFHGNTGGIDRYAFAYFVHPNRDTVLRPIEGMKREGWVPRYRGIGRTAAEHIAARIKGEDRMVSMQIEADRTAIAVPVEA